MSEHALLSASGASKWLNCPPSARLEERVPEQGSMFAKEGTLAHELAALKLEHKLGLCTAADYKRLLASVKFSLLYQQEMEHYTEEYVEYICGIIFGYNFKPFVAVEKRLDYSHYAPDGFGTGDCVIVTPNELHVIDFKYGKGVPVSAHENPQLKLYALGAYQAFNPLIGKDAIVKLHIIQPRISNSSCFEIPLKDLLAFGEYVKPRAQLAFAGGGECTPGEWCRFCKVKATCKARSNNYLALEAHKDFAPKLLTNDEIGGILKRAQDLARWAADLEEHALSECLKGNTVPGWKAVEGRSIRAFKDMDLAFKELTAAGVEEAMLYERKPLTLASVEKLIGKPRFRELLIDHVHTPPGKPALVIESDKREAIQVNGTAAADFGPETAAND